MVTPAIRTGTSLIFSAATFPPNSLPCKKRSTMATARATTISHASTAFCPEPRHATASVALRRWTSHPGITEVAILPLLPASQLYGVVLDVLYGLFDHLCTCELVRLLLCPKVAAALRWTVGSHANSPPLGVNRPDLIDQTTSTSWSTLSDAGGRTRQPQEAALVLGPAATRTSRLGP